jgi:hypothetical protein
LDYRIWRYFALSFLAVLLFFLRRTPLQRAVGSVDLNLVCGWIFGDITDLFALRPTAEYIRSSFHSQVKIKSLEAMPAALSVYKLQSSNSLNHPGAPITPGKSGDGVP